MKSRKIFMMCLCSCAVSVLFIVCGLVLLFIWPTILKYIIESNMILTPNTHAYQLWKKFPEAFPIDFYFFNWTNPQDVYNETIKPKFREMGPYRFLETKEKDNVVWNDNGTVTFNHLKFWYRNQENVVDDIRDEITTVNPVAISAVYAARSWSYLIRKGLSFSLSSMAPTIHITRTVSQMLFEGYQDDMITIAQKLPMLAGNSLPNWDKFGWFYTRNGSSHYEGVFNMGTGTHNTSFGRLYSWNYWTQTPYFENGCGVINGSAGEFFPTPDMTSITFFSPDLCRTMTLKYAGQKFVDNILGYKYTVDQSMLDNGTLHPENHCYCNGECVPSGLLNVSSCRFGSPSFASLPHFHKADPYYLGLVDGMNPDEEKHEFYLILEPTTAIPLEVSARLQINLLMQPVSGIAMYENAPRVFMPMLWFEQKVKIPSNEAFMLRLLLNLPVICTSVGIVLIFIAFIVKSCLVYKICTTKLCDSNKDKILFEEQNIPLRSEHKIEILKKL